MSQAGAVTTRHRFDEGALSEYLAAALPGFAGPLEVKQFHGGQSNPTYLLSTPARRYVLRSKPGPVAKLLPSAHAIEREFRVDARAGRHGLSGARGTAAATRRERDRPRILRHGVHVDGRILWDPALPDLDAAARAARCTTR